ncbi:MAG: DinB family protein [Cytophagales bacterium]|nr:MAG: DinB family protein [Cytophagales bacterium]
MIQSLKTLFERDLNRLKSEIEAYQNEANLWQTEKNIANSAGNLCLHLIGNLNTFIGAQLGKTDYIRNRYLEFSLKNVPKTELISKIEATIQMVSKTLENLKEEELTKDYPIVVLAEKTTTEYLLIHLTTHLNYHLGQINYHRRLLDKG